MSTGPRVLLVITRNQRRGAESAAVVLAERLAGRGFSTRLLGLAPSPTRPDLPVPTLGPAPLAPPTLWRLRRAIASADLVVACGSTTLPASILAGRWTGRPVVYQNIGDPLYWAGSPSRRARVRALLARTAGVAALTEQTAAVLEGDFGVPARRLRVIRNGRSAAQFRPAAGDERAVAREALALPHDAPLIAFVGALSAEKRPEVAVAALAALPSNTRLVVAGDGPLRGALSRQAADVAPGRVHFLGQVATLADVYRASDALVLTSESEGVPGVLVEAGLCGLPVVATEVGFVRDVVVPDLTGRLVSVGDAAATAGALTDVLARAAPLGAAARAHCTSRFDLDTVADQWADLLHGVLGPRRAA